MEKKPFYHHRGEREGIKSHREQKSIFGHLLEWNGKLSVLKIVEHEVGEVEVLSAACPCSYYVCMRACCRKRMIVAACDDAPRSSYSDHLISS